MVVDKKLYENKYQGKKKKKEMEFHFKRSHISSDGKNFHPSEVKAWEEALIMQVAHIKGFGLKTIM